MGEVFARRFELLEPIAEGGMGSVWTVRDARDGRMYAGKLLRHSDAVSLLRFIREQATRVEHDHVVTPLSWAGEDDRVIFTMPLVRGGSVATLIGDFGPLPLAWVVTLLDQTLQVLSAVHAAGIVHRDVKPSNLLLEPTGTARPHLRLTDFGVAVPVDQPRLTTASQVVGTTGYLAPEVLSGHDPDARQDLYAVGLVGLEMLCGVRPPGTLAAAQDLALQDPATRPLVELLERAAAADPRRRPASAEAFRAELSALSSPPVTADPEGPCVFDHFAPPPTPTPRPRARPSPRRTVDRNRAAAVALLVIGVLAAIAAVWLLLGS